MAKDGLLPIVGAIALIVANPSLLRATGEDKADAVAAALAVQTALQQGRDFLQRGDARAAVQTLEAQLSRINGNATYLALLRDAYRAYVRELRIARQDAEAQRYQQRLQILDPGAALDAPTPNRGTSAPATPPANRATPPPGVASSQPPAKPEPKVRAIREEELTQVPPLDARRQAASTLLARAEEEFFRRRYCEAGFLFEQVQQTDASVIAASRERWAYCKLYRVVQLLNQPPAGGPSWTDLESEVRAAMQLAPRLAFANELLSEIDKRKNGTQTVGPKPAASIPVCHYDAGSDGWARAETANFRIFHNASRVQAEQVARIAEQTRTDMSRKWLGTVPEDWCPRCDIFLHPTAQDYSRETGKAAASPGHSSLKIEASRVVTRRIDLHWEACNLLVAVVPHETTHVLLAGQFGDQPLPRWADEGIAVLSEPRDQVERHLRNLPSCRQQNSLFSVQQLMHLADYPEPSYIKGFYAESVSLIEYLSALKGPQELTAFLRDARKMGYEQALARHYGFRNFDDLQQRWNQRAFASDVPAASPRTSTSGMSPDRP
jgi:hypothetical protein